jgi:succinoglycan biosynthesis protein ExoO
MDTRLEPLVSIIIPAYRAQETIAFTIQSLQAQKYGNWEAIIGSNDGVDYLAILGDQGIQDPRLKQVYTEGWGTGESPARNAATAIAQGEIFANLDADDAFAPNRLVELVPLAMEYGAAIDNTGVHNTDLILYKRPFRDRTTVTWATAQDILSPRVPFFPVFRREFLGKGWRKFAFAADVLFNLELLTRVGKMAIHPDSLYRYYKRDNSITQSKRAFETIDIGYQQIFEALAGEELELTDAIRKAAIAEFSENQRLNRVFYHYMQEGRCQNLEEFLDLTENGQADWLKPELEAVTIGS